MFESVSTPVVYSLRSIVWRLGTTLWGIARESKGSLALDQGLWQSSTHGAAQGLTDLVANSCWHGGFVVFGVVLTNGNGELAVILIFQEVQI